VDLVLLDLNLGKENGIDVLKELKGIEPELLVIVITGYDRSRALSLTQLGAFHYMKSVQGDASGLSSNCPADTSLKREVRAIRQGGWRCSKRCLWSRKLLAQEIIRQAREVAVR